MDYNRRYITHVVHAEADLKAAQNLRADVFGTTAPDADIYDDLYTSVLIRDVVEDCFVGCFRFQHFERDADLTNSYAGAHYDLRNIARANKDMLELGRLCVSGNHNTSDIMRTVWAFLTEYVDRHDVGLMFGCTSFAGTDPTPYDDCFHLLGAAHLAPCNLQPLIKSSEIHSFSNQWPKRRPDVLAARKSMPSLLRSYLGMGGWVSDHAVIDRTLNTLHVFTGVEIAKIPESRKRLLRADAGLV